MASKSAWVTDPGRQTQNPERGRKHFERELVHSPPFRSSDPKPREGTETRNPAPHPQLRHAPEVVRPKTPRGDGNAYRPPHHSHATAPCPQTQNPERGRKPSWWDMDERDYRGRRTQNPERGRKLNNTFFERGAVESVVRPKTPRGDGNWTQNRTGCGRCSSRQTQNPERGRKHTADDSYVRVTSSQSSDPKPREGTET
ncbi:Uncharacterised protein [Mycobacterium tuberculosis]|nr:Uncharacterised protein [Mycobacterium tuberculosis]